MFAPPTASQGAATPPPPPDTWTPSIIGRADPNIDLEGAITPTSRGKTLDQPPNYSPPSSTRFKRAPR